MSIKGLECKFVLHVPKTADHQDDLHLVKVTEHHDDGTLVPAVRLIKNYQRSIWVERPGSRDYQDKKEWQSEDRLIEFKTTESDRTATVLKALGMQFMKDPRKGLKSPYLYGNDIKTGCLIKQQYRDKYPDCSSFFDVCFMDSETNVHTGNDEILMLTSVFRKTVYIVVDKAFVKGYTNPVGRVLDLMDIHLKAHIEKNNLKIEIEVVENELEVITRMFSRLHTWKPDFVAFWNMDFDIARIEAACGRLGQSMADLFSDPAVPKDRRFYSFVEAKLQKVTQAGKVTSLKSSDGWSTVKAPSSFYVVCAMRVYRSLRVHLGEEPSYSLNSILDKKLGERKLNFKEAGDRKGLEWHSFMQKRYPLEYIVYNAFDSISMMLLDAKTMDLALSAPNGCGISDFSDFKKQPRRNMDKLHFFLRSMGRVAGCSGDLEVELDEQVLDLGGWIITLPIHLLTDTGIPMFSDAPHIRSSIRGYVNDLDVSASYPHGGITLNISKKTTYRERIAVEGDYEEVYRRAGLNLTAGTINAVQICRDVLGMPSLTELLECFEADHATP